jgi:hypothetical protein
MLLTTLFNLNTVTVTAYGEATFGLPFRPAHLSASASSLLKTVVTWAQSQRIDYGRHGAAIINKKRCIHVIRIIWCFTVKPAEAYAARPHRGGWGQRRCGADANALRREEAGIRAALLPPQE